MHMACKIDTVFSDRRMTTIIPRFGISRLKLESVPECSRRAAVYIHDKLKRSNTDIVYRDLKLRGADRCIDLV
jgi:hypothetical protein